MSGDPSAFSVLTKYLTPTLFAERDVVRRETILVVRCSMCREHLSLPVPDDQLVEIAPRLDIHMRTLHEWWRNHDCTDPDPIDLSDAELQALFEGAESEWVRRGERVEQLRAELARRGR